MGAHLSGEARTSTCQSVHRHSSTSPSCVRRSGEPASPQWAAHTSDTFGTAPSGCGCKQWCSPCRCLHQTHRMVPSGSCGPEGRLTQRCRSSHLMLLLEETVMSWLQLHRPPESKQSTDRNRLQVSKGSTQNMKHDDVKQKQGDCCILYNQPP